MNVGKSSTNFVQSKQKGAYFDRFSFTGRIILVKVQRNATIHISIERELIETSILCGYTGFCRVFRVELL